jgi:hypothetical protein
VVHHQLWAVGYQLRTDGRFQSAADVPLPIFDLRLPIFEVPPLWRPTEVLIKVRNEV